MRLRRITAFAAVAGLATAGLAACGTPDSGGDGQSPSGGGSGATSDVKACLVASMGGLEDRSFNQSANEGLMRAASELGVQTAVVAPQADADFTPAINNMVSQGCHLIIGVGFDQATQISEVAAGNPDVDFALVDSTFSEELPNAKPLLFDTAQASFLAGYLAAGMSTTGSVATFLGGKIPPTMVFADGFVQGAEYYNEENGTSVQVLGWDVAAQDGVAIGNFQDVSRGQQFANQLIEQGADVILPVAGAAGTGALAAARASNGVSIIWVDSDGYYTEPDFSDLIMTSVLKQVGNAVYDTIEEYKNGEFTAEAYVGVLENDGVALAPYHDYEDVIPTELQEGVDSVRERIINGEVSITSPSSPSVG